MHNRANMLSDIKYRFAYATKLPTARALVYHDDVVCRWKKLGLPPKPHYRPPLLPGKNKKKVFQERKNTFYKKDILLKELSTKAQEVERARSDTRPDLALGNTGTNQKPQTMSAKETHRIENCDTSHVATAAKKSAVPKNTVPVPTTNPEDKSTEKPNDKSNANINDTPVPTLPNEDKKQIDAEKNNVPKVQAPKTEPEPAVETESAAIPLLRKLSHERKVGRLDMSKFSKFGATQPDNRSKRQGEFGAKQNTKKRPNDTKATVKPASNEEKRVCTTEADNKPTRTAFDIQQSSKPKTTGHAKSAEQPARHEGVQKASTTSTQHSAEKVKATAQTHETRNTPVTTNVKRISHRWNAQASANTTSDRNTVTKATATNVCRPSLVSQRSASFEKNAKSQNTKHVNFRASLRSAPTNSKGTAGLSSPTKVCKYTEKVNFAVFRFSKLIQKSSASPVLKVNLGHTHSILKCCADCEYVIRIVRPIRNRKLWS